MSFPIQIDFHVLPSSVNNIIREMLAGMLLADKLAEIENTLSDSTFKILPRPGDNNWANVMDFAEDDDRYQEDFRFHVFVKVKLIVDCYGRMFGQNIWCSESECYTDWSTGHSATDEKVGRDCFWKFTVSGMKDIMDLGLLLRTQFDPEIKFPTYDEFMESDENDDFLYGGETMPFFLHNIIMYIFNVLEQGNGCLVKLWETVKALTLRKSLEVMRSILV